jgi:hypothetical protein
MSKSAIQPGGRGATRSIRYPRIADNDRDTITATMNGEPVRSWFYLTDDERREKIRRAHEFAEGWLQSSIWVDPAVAQPHMIGAEDE